MTRSLELVLGRPTLYVVVRNTRALRRLRLLLEARHRLEVVVLVTGHRPEPQWAGIRERVFDPEVDAVMLVGDYHEGSGWPEISRQLRLLGWRAPELVR